MKFTNDPIYRVFNKEKPDKEKVLGQALAAMEAMPGQKRVPRRRLVLAWGSIAAVLLIILIPVVILSQQGLLKNNNTMAPGRNESNYDAPSEDDMSNDYVVGIYFDLVQDNNGNTDAAISGAEGPLASYKENFASLSENVMIYYTTVTAPVSATEVYIENLNVYGKYSVITEENITVIHLYFAYQSKNYLVVIRCADSARINYYLAHLHAA